MHMSNQQHHHQYSKAYFVRQGKILLLLWPMVTLLQLMLLSMPSQLLFRKRSTARGVAVHVSQSLAWAVTVRVGACFVLL